MQKFPGSVNVSPNIWGKLRPLSQAGGVVQIGVGGLGDKVHKAAGVALSFIVGCHPDVPIEGQIQFGVYHIGGFCDGKLHRSVGQNSLAALVGFKVHTAGINGLQHRLGPGVSAGVIQPDVNCLHSFPLLSTVPPLNNPDRGRQCISGVGVFFSQYTIHRSSSPSAVFLPINTPFFRMCKNLGYLHTSHSSVRWIYR